MSITTEEVVSYNNYNSCNIDTILRFDSFYLPLGFLVGWKCRSKLKTNITGFKKLTTFCVTTYYIKTL